LALALGTGSAVLVASSSGAATLSCPNFNDTDVPTPPAGQTGYLFIGTSISTGTSSISGTYTLGGSSFSFGPIAGTQQGNGSFHYIVNLPQGAVVTSATVTGATNETTVTVSGCLNGPPVTTTTTTVTPSPTAAPRAPAPVVAATRFTG
jgi:hypothetical protein